MRVFAFITLIAAGTASAEQSYSIAYTFQSKSNCVEKLKGTSDLGATLFTSSGNGLAEVTSIEAYCTSLFPTNISNLNGSSSLENGNSEQQKEIKFIYEK